VARRKTEVEFGLYVHKSGRPRYIVDIRPPFVLYSKGGDRMYACRLKTFKRWMRDSSYVRLDSVPEFCLEG
jgi:hypothetical protein